MLVFIALPRLDRASRQAFAADNDDRRPLTGGIGTHDYSLISELMLADRIYSLIRQLRAARPGDRCPVRDAGLAHAGQPGWRLRVQSDRPRRYEREDRRESAMYPENLAR